MTIPNVTRFDDFRFALYDMADGSQAILNPDSVIDPQFETVPGVGRDRLKSCTFNIPWYEDARDSFDFDHLQLLAIGRYGVSDQDRWAEGGDLTLWGVVLKPKEGYSARVARDSIQVQSVQVEELLKARKVFEYVDAKNKPLSFTNEYPDDIAKELVRRCFAGVDIDGNSREWEWGTLTVEADSSQCTDRINLTILSGTEPDDTLFKHLDDLARTYDFDFQLKVSLVGGAFTFTFGTQAPYGGSDLTTGENQVQIKDLYNLVPSATRFRDAAFRATRMYVRGYSDSAEDAQAITDWGLWEGVADGTQVADADIALEKARVKAGAEYGFEATGASGMVLWIRDFKAGDTVNRINNRLGIAADSEKIAAVIGRFQNKVLQLTIRWGDREPTQNDRRSGGAYHPGAPGGTVLEVAEPVGNTASAGDDPTHLVYGDHIHDLNIYADDAGIMTLTAGVGYIIGAGGIATSIDGDGKLVVDGSGVCYWTRVDAGSSDWYLRPTTFGDDVKIYDADQGLAFTITGEGDVIGNEQALGTPYRLIALTDYDMVASDHDTTKAGLHDLTVSGNIISQIDTTASRFEWLGGSDGEDAVKVRNWSVYSNTAGTTLRAQYNITNGLRLLDTDGSTPVFTVAPSTGNSVWKAGATWTIEGDVYTLPTAYPATSGMALVSTDAGVLSWGAARTAATVQADEPSPTWVGLIWVDI